MNIQLIKNFILSILFFYFIYFTSKLIIILNIMNIAWN